MYDVLLLGLRRIEQVAKNGIERHAKYNRVENAKGGPILRRSGYPGQFPYPAGRIELVSISRRLGKKK
jgi:hypothetical protein